MFSALIGPAVGLVIHDEARRWLERVAIRACRRDDDYRAVVLRLLAAQPMRLGTCWTLAELEAKYQTRIVAPALGADLLAVAAQVRDKEQNQ